LIVLEGNFAEEVRHSLLGTIAADTRSVEYYWFDRWYNVFRFTEPSGDLRNYYCNINLPPVIEGNVLSFIDLDMDVVVAPDFTCRVVDQDEFHDNASRFGYPAEIQERAMAAVDELLALVQTRQFPFSHPWPPGDD
jgi:protein associated with RNAse G/E